MTITVHNVTDQASVQTLFEELYTSSLPYMEQDGNPWRPLGLDFLDAEAKKDVFTKAFFSVLDIEGGIINRVALDGSTISMMSGVIEDGLWKVNYSMHKEINGTRAWLYDSAIMHEQIQKLREFFNPLGAFGYSFQTTYNSSFYKYRRLNSPILDLHSSITEETPENMPNVRLITYLF